MIYKSVFTENSVATQKHSSVYVDNLKIMHEQIDRRFAVSTNISI